MRLIMFTALSLLVLFYLFFSYIRFYRFIGDWNLKSPYMETSLVLENPQGKGLVKYIALGDSLSAGVGSSNVNDTFVYQYALNLSKKYEKVNLLNLARSGDTTADIIENQITKAIEEKPDYISLLVGTNDIHNKQTVNVFREKYQYILNELLTKTDAKITVINIPYLGSNKIVYPPFNFLLDFRIKQFNQAISSLVSSMANNDRIQFVDLYKDSYTPFKQNPNYYSLDLFHPSNEGYLLWGKIINAN